MALNLDRRPYIGQQLSLDGETDSAGKTVHNMNMLIEHYFVNAIRKELAGAYADLKYDVNKMAYNDFHPGYPEPLFKYDRCGKYHEFDDSLLHCDLQAGHEGPHWDSQARIEWADRH